MTGKRLLIGSLTMVGFVPTIVFYFLRLSTVEEYLAIAVPAFFGWCVADLVSTILSRPRSKRQAEEADPLLTRPAPEKQIRNSAS